MLAGQVFAFCATFPPVGGLDSTQKEVELEKKFDTSPVDRWTMLDHGECGKAESYISYEGAGSCACQFLVQPDPVWFNHSGYRGNETERGGGGEEGVGVIFISSCSIILAPHPCPFQSFSACWGAAISLPGLSLPTPALHLWQLRQQRP